MSHDRSRRASCASTNCASCGRWLHRPVSNLEDTMLGFPQPSQQPRPPAQLAGAIGVNPLQKLDNELKNKQSDYNLDQKAVLILTERKEDLVTPLLTPWTYEAMLHEFIGIFNNKVDIVKKQKAILGGGD